MDIELARLVSEDLEFLFNEWNQDIDDASLRRSSPVLRSLLVEGQLGNISHQAGKEIRILAPAICRLITEAELKHKNYYQAGGAKYKGMQVQSTSMVNRALSPEEIKADYERTKDVMGKSYPVKLSVFLKQTSFVVDGVLINREEVIKYVANKLGGAHYDSARLNSTPKGGPSLEDKYALLDKARVEIQVAGKNAIYYELLSIGQRIVNSRDVRHLKRHLQQIINRPGVIHA
jgi:hypothetical protein